MTRVLTAADTALLLESADLDASMRLLTALTAAAPTGVTELVPGARTILVRFDPSVVAADALSRQLRLIDPAALPSDGAGSEAAAATNPGDDPIGIPVRYDGDDLAAVAELLGVSAEALAARHAAAAWRVAFTGFAPGFGYLVGDDPIFDVPRRSSPRTRIPAGSVGLAGRYSGVYPKESPGGWQIIGRTDLAMWDLDRDPPALLTPGAAVRFERVERELVQLTAATPQPVERPHAVEVVRPGLQLLTQDLGRPGMAAQGVSASGTADRTALKEANRAVGNAPGEAGLELAGGGALLRFRGSAVVALAGALTDASVRAGDAVQGVEIGRAVAIDDGDELRIGAVREGMRVLLSIRGGIALDPVLGSLSTDTLAILGPRPLTAGSVLPLHGPHASVAAVERTRAPRIPLPVVGETTELRIVLGPRHDWFTPAAISTLLEQEWEVSPNSDRVGLRLSGAIGLERARAEELESEGAVTGAIQVPTDGQPVLFLPDHPLTGGYPIIAAVIDRDLDRAGQLPPGARLRFRLLETPTSTA